MKKRITALLLALLCLCGTAACGKDNGETAENTAPAGQTDTAPQDGEPTAAQPAEPEEEDNTAAAERYVNNLNTRSSAGRADVLCTLPGNRCRCARRAV